MEFCQEWEERAAWLFQNIPNGDDEYDFNPVVCVEHKRYIPCRPCMYDAPAKVPYSANLLDVEIVRDYQLGIGE